MWRIREAFGLPLPPPSEASADIRDPLSKPAVHRIVLGALNATSSR